MIVGTPEHISDDIEHWFKGGAADGFNLMPEVLPGGLRISPTAWCRFCNSAAFSAPDTKGERCVSTSVCRDL